MASTAGGPAKKHSSTMAANPNPVTVATTGLRAATALGGLGSTTGRAERDGRFRGAACRRRRAMCAAISASVVSSGTTGGLGDSGTTSSGVTSGATEAGGPGLDGLRYPFGSNGGRLRPGDPGRLLAGVEEVVRERVVRRRLLVVRDPETREVGEDFVGVVPILLTLAPHRAAGRRRRRAAPSCGGLLFEIEEDPGNLQRRRVGPARKLVGTGHIPSNRRNGAARADGCGLAAVVLATGGRAIGGRAMGGRPVVGDGTRELGADSVCSEELRTKASAGATSPAAIPASTPAIRARSVTSSPAPCGSFRSSKIPPSRDTPSTTGTSFVSAVSEAPGARRMATCRTAAAQSSSSSRSLWLSNLSISAICSWVSFSSSFSARSSSSDEISPSRSSASSSWRARDGRCGPRPALLGPMLHDLHELFPSLLVELREDQSDHLPVVRRVDAEVGGIEGFLDRLHRTLVVRVHDEHRASGTLKPAICCSGTSDP